ncbi:MAG: hypothetical protein J6C23_09535 [Clostridia bacterium]|nr:hypothetical protein [Clostridia bacterium]
MDLKENKFYENTDKKEVSMYEGLSNLIRKSYFAVDRSNLSVNEKRNLLFSLYSFRCLFDNKELYRISNILLEYGCSFICSSAYKNEKGVYEITDKNGKKHYKFDAGSPIFIKLLKERKLNKFASIPQKLTLFEMVYACITLNSATNALRALWYSYFPYVFLVAPTEHDLYDRIKEILCTDKVFSCVINTEEGDNIYVDEEDIREDNPILKDWYAPFIAYRREKPDGTARYNERLLAIMKTGDFRKVMELSDLFLAAYPDDEDLLINNVTARLALCASAEGKEREQLLKLNLSVINDALASTVDNQASFLYFSGMTKLGLQDLDGAEKDFEATLKADPSYDNALKMLMGMKNAENLNQKSE